MQFGLSVLMQNYADYDRFEAAEQGGLRLHPDGPRLGGLQQRPAPRQAGRAARLRLDLDRRAPLHALHHGRGPDPAALRTSPGAPSGRPRDDGRGAALARPDPGGRGGRHDRHAGRRAELLARRRARHRPSRVRRQADADGRDRATASSSRSRSSGRRSRTRSSRSRASSITRSPRRRSDPSPAHARAARIDRHVLAWGSPETMPIAANLGLKPLVNPQRPWLDYVDELTWTTTRSAPTRATPARCA